MSARYKAEISSSHLQGPGRALDLAGTCRKGLSTSYPVFGAEGGLGSMSCRIGMSGILVPGRVTKRGLGVQTPYCQNNAKIMSLCCGCEHNMTVHVKHTLPSRSLLLNSALVYDFLKCLKTQE